jgi:hypothetical protein
LGRPVKIETRRPDRHDGARVLRAFSDRLAGAIARRGWLPDRRRRHRRDLRQMAGGPGRTRTCNQTVMSAWRTARFSKIIMICSRFRGCSLAFVHVEFSGTGGETVGNCSDPACSRCFYRADLSVVVTCVKQARKLMNYRTKLTIAAALAFAAPVVPARAGQMDNCPLNSRRRRSVRRIASGHCQNSKIC